MTTKSLIISFVVLLVITAGAYQLYGAAKPQIAQPANISVVNSATGTISLAMSPATVSLEPNTTTTITLTADTGTGNMTGAEIELTFDPTALQVSSFTKATFLSNPLSGPTITSGKATIALGAPAASGGKTGAGDVATIVVKPLKAGTFTLTYGDATFATSTTVGNMLKSVSNATIIAYGRADLSGATGTPDGKVDLYDLNPIIADYNKTGAAGFVRTDMSGLAGTPDGKVDLHDYSYFVTKYGTTY